jgi:NADH:ubiquinone oxidoreductase subunit C
MMTITMKDMGNKTLKEIAEYQADINRRLEKTNLTEALYSVSFHDTLDKLKKGHILKAIKSFILFLHKKQIQYVTIYDIKKQDRYKNILLYIYKNANNTERWLYDMASFIYDGDVLRCKIY